MKALHLYLIVFLLGLLLSCTKRKYPESSVENATVYNFSATIGNKPVSLNAGNNGYYMYSSYKQDSNHVYNFTGVLKQLDCVDCYNSLKIQVNDFKVSDIDGPVIIDSALKVRNYPILSGIDSYEIQFDPLFNKTAATYAWDFGDGSSSTQASPLHTYSKAGNYTVRLKIISADGCENTIIRSEKINGSTASCKTAISVVSATANTIYFSQATYGGKQPYKYSWSFGDGTTSTDANPNHTYALRGSYPVMLKVTDANNDVVSAIYNAVTQTDLSSCAANYRISSVKPVLNAATVLALSKIVITWIDDAGVVYTSNSDLQPAASRFEIVSVEDQGINENNEAIKRLRIRFNCIVYNGDKALPVQNAEATIAVAYKR